MKNVGKNNTESISSGKLAAQSEKKARIMLVDDEEDITGYLKMVLERHGFDVVVFNDPSKALNAYKPEQYDLLLLDIRMPGINGLDLFRKIKDVDPKIRVCFLSAFEEYRGEFRQRYPQLDEVNCYLKKPIGMDELLKKIRLMLESG